MCATKRNCLTCSRTDSSLQTNPPLPARDAGNFTPTQGMNPISEWRGNNPAELELAIAKCLRKTPAERYQGAEELLLHLRPLAGEGPLSRHRNPGWGRPVEPRGKNRARPAHRF